MCFEVKTGDPEVESLGGAWDARREQFNDQRRFTRIFSIKAAKGERTYHIYCLHLPAAKFRCASEALCLETLRELALTESFLVRDHS
jgi:hypothetical protein